VLWSEPEDHHAVAVSRHGDTRHKIGDLRTTRRRRLNLKLRSGCKPVRDGDGEVLDSERDKGMHRVDSPPARFGQRTARNILGCRIRHRTST
ncbi:MAG: hypothetical protein ACRDOK_29310, partial [Streptosporangiaceae bacterium]